ncbi:MAG TPA: ribbon-helix-helix domain-containing protein [Novosphingobium sp.]|nr:ribbon-helix-helix domain-containing protein [Novosphingobium sp.]
MSRFAKLADKPKDIPTQREVATAATTTSLPPSRVGRKAISGYFSPQMSLALHICARRNGLSLQALMAEAFDDVLRKYGDSPVGQ